MLSYARAWSNSLSSLFQWVLGECVYDVRDWDEWQRQGWVVEDIESIYMKHPNLTGSKGAEIVNQGTDDILSSLAYHHQAVKDGHSTVSMNQKIIQWVCSSIRVFRFTPSRLARHIEDLCSSGGKHRIHDRSDTPLFNVLRESGETALSWFHLIADYFTDMVDTGILNPDTKHYTSVTTWMLQTTNTGKRSHISFYPVTLWQLNWKTALAPSG